MIKDTIVLVNIYRQIEFVNSKPLMPLACLYLASYLNGKGYKVLIQNISNREEIDDYVEKAIHSNPLLIGISVTFGLYTKECIEYCSKIKIRKSDIPIVWGGVHASAIFDLCMKKEYIDFVIRGEGEIALYELSEALRGQMDFNKVRNLVFKRDGKIIRNNEVPIVEKNVDSFTLNFDLLSDYENYIETSGGNRIFHALQASRGCPFNCTFCYNSTFNNRRWRYHSLQRVINDVAKLREKINFNKILFIDDQFFANEARAKAIISKLYNMGITLFCPDMRLENIQRSMMEFLIEHECTHIFVGTESENDRVLKVMNKQITQKLLLEKFEIIKQYPSLLVSTNFILGIPSHTKKEIMNSIKFVLQWQRKISNLKIGLNTYSPLPGTELYQYAIKLGYPPPDDVEYFIGFSNSEVAGKFIKYRKMEWLKAEPEFKAKLNFFPWISAFYSILIPSINDNIYNKIIKIPFRFVTYLRLRFLFTRYNYVDRKLYYQVCKILSVSKRSLLQKVKKSVCWKMASR